MNSRRSLNYAGLQAILQITRHWPGRLLIVGLAALTLLSACAGSREDGASSTPVTTPLAQATAILEQPDSPVVIVPSPSPDKTAETPVAASETTVESSPNAQEIPATSAPDPSPTSQPPASNEYGVTGFLRDRVSEGKELWPFVSLDDPEFVMAEQAANIDPLDLVLGVSLNGEHKAYPTSMMWFHHVVNDIIGGQPVAVTY